MAAETWLGASACARGSHTCNGTRPALVPNPRTSNTKATAAVNEPAPTEAICANPVPPEALASTEKPASTRRKLSWVIAAYHSAADRTCGRLAWSVSTRIVEASAISSHMSRNATMSAPAGTSCMPTSKTASAAQLVLDAAGPLRAYPRPKTATRTPTAGRDEHEDPAEAVRCKHHASDRQGDRDREGAPVTTHRQRPGHHAGAGEQSQTPPRPPQPWLLPYGRRPRPSPRGRPAPTGPAARHEPRSLVGHRRVIWRSAATM